MQEAGAARFHKNVNKSDYPSPSPSTGLRQRQVSGASGANASTKSPSSPITVTNTLSQGGTSESNSVGEVSTSGANKVSAANNGSTSVVIKEVRSPLDTFIIYALIVSNILLSLYIFMKK
jgi:hypothetical protein